MVMDENVYRWNICDLVGFCFLLEVLESFLNIFVLIVLEGFLILLFIIIGDRIF